MRGSSTRGTLAPISLMPSPPFLDHALRRELHTLDDGLVAGAAADVARKLFPKLGVAQLHILPEQREGGHHEPRRAEPALEAVAVAERLLERMQRAVVLESLDRGDF